MANINEVPWDKIHTLSIYDTKFSNVNEKSELIEESIILLHNKKKFTPLFRFIRDEKDDFLRMESVISSLRANDLLSESSERNPGYYMGAGLKEVKVLTKIPKQDFADILEECIKDTVFLWENSKFQQVLKQSIRELCIVSTIEYKNLFVPRGEQYVLSNKIGSIIDKEKCSAGKFAGMFIDNSSFVIPNIIVNDLYYKLEDCRLEYTDEENNIKVSFLGSDLEPYKPGYKLKNFSNLRIERISNDKKISIPKESYSILINKELKICTSKFENRLILISNLETKKPIERVTLTEIMAKNRFKSLAK